MLGIVKVYNKGKKPLVWERSHRGTFVIHPGKHDVFSKEKAEEIMKKFPNAVSEKEFNDSKAPAEKPAQGDKKG